MVLALFSTEIRAQQTTVLEGVVKERGTRAPLALARVSVLGAGGEAAVECDGDGKFRLELAPGAVKVVVSATGHERATFDETLAAGQRLEVVYHLDAARYGKYETTVKGARAREEIARTTLDAEEVQKIPGTHGDALRAVTNLPGVARAPLDSGQLVIWGAAPGDSSVFVGGHVIPLAFHFGLGTSTFNSNLVEKIEYVPGNFGVRYGRAIGGIIDVTPRAGARDGYHGYANLDFVDGGAMIEGPLGKGSFAVAARRSLIDVGLAAASHWVNLGFTLAPTYYDYQAMLDYPLAGGKFKALVYGSDDELSLVIKNGPDSDPALKGQFDTHIWYHALNLSWSRRFGKLDLDVTTSAGPSHTNASLGQSLGYALDLFDWSARVEGRYRVSKRLVITGGLDLEGDWYRATATAPYVATEGEIQPPTSILKSQQIAEGAWEWNPALYLDARIQPIDRLLIIPGVRFDAYQGQGASVDPRLNVRLDVAPRTTIFGGIGTFHEPTNAPYADALLGNPRLRPEGALHLSLGVETRPIAKLPSLSFKVTGFFKQLWGLASSSPNFVQRDGRIVAERYVDSGIGRVFGVEALVRQDLSKYVWGWIAYTLSRSERQDHPGDPWRLFPFDQTHILTVVLSSHLPWNLDAGGRFRFVTGNPDTPYDFSVYLSDYDVYVGVPGPIYSIRQPDFVQLDLRVDKKFVFDSWLLSVYVDVSNVTNHKNVEGYVQAYDYSQRAAVTGIPIFPSLGVKGAF